MFICSKIYYGCGHRWNPLNPSHSTHQLTTETSVFTVYSQWSLAWSTCGQFHNLSFLQKDFTSQDLSCSLWLAISDAILSQFLQRCLGHHILTRNPQAHSPHELLIVDVLKEQKMIFDLFLFSSSTGKYIVLNDIRQWLVSSVLSTLEVWQFGVPIVCPTWGQWELISDSWRHHIAYSCSILTDETSNWISSWTCINYRGFIWMPLTCKLLYY